MENQDYIGSKSIKREGTQDTSYAITSNRTRQGVQQSGEKSLKRALQAPQIKQVEDSTQNSRVNKNRIPFTYNDVSDKSSTPLRTTFIDDYINGKTPQEESWIRSFNNIDNQATSTIYKVSNRSKNLEHTTEQQRAYCDSIIKSTVDLEGGYSNLFGDRGGRTKYGITYQTWKNFANLTLGINPTIDNHRSMSKEDAMAIYKENYWKAGRIDEIEDNYLKHLIFDMKVNNTGNVGNMIQNTLNNHFGKNMEIDGIMGSKTIEAINSVDPTEFYDRLLDTREQHYYKESKKPNQLQFLNGWLEDRVENFRLKR